MNVNTNEQETTIIAMRTDECIKIYSSDSTMISKLDKLVNKCPDYYKVIKVLFFKHKVK